MSADAQPTSNIEIDDSLMWINYMDSAQKVPGQVLYEEITADSNSTSGFTFNFRSPADNALLDNEIIIEYQFTLSKTNIAQYFRQLGGITAIGNDNLKELFIAPRQCFPVARAIQNFSVTINGSNFNVQPVYWLDVMNRLYFSEEDAKTFCSTSGGEFDSADPRHTAPWRMLRTASGDGTGVVDPATLVMNYAGLRNAATDYVSNIPLMQNDIGNRGLWNRFYRFLLQYYNNKCRGSADANYDWDYLGGAGNDEYRVKDNADRKGNLIRTDLLGDTENGSISFSLFERLPIAPFVFHPSKDPRMSIPNIKQINITAQFVANDLVNHIFQGDANGVFGGEGDFIAATNAPSIAFQSNKSVKLHCKWRLTDMAIPPVIRIPAPKYLQYIKSLDLAGIDATSTSNSGSVDLGSVTFSNIQLDAIPDKFFIYVKRANTDWRMCMPSEYQLSISTITLTIGGSSGRLTSMNSVQMYDNFLKHSAHGGENKLKYDEWYRYRCCAILEASDIGLIAGAGYNYKTNLTVKVNLESFWDIKPAFNSERVLYLDENTAKFDFVVLCCYNHHWIELNSSGGSKSGMTMVPRL